MTLTLYTRPGCHLCEEMKVVLDRVKARLSLTLEEVDISLEAALTERYRHDIPVLFANGIEVGRHRIGEAELMQRLKNRMAVERSSRIG